MKRPKLAGIAALVVATTLPTTAWSVSDDELISDDSSLEQYVSRYRQPRSERDIWSTPCLAAVAHPAESGDQAMARIVAQYDRAELDRGGWINPYLPSAAAGNALVSTPVGTGVTLVATSREGGSAEEQVSVSIPHYTRAMLDRGGWENPFVVGPQYAAGNALLAVRPGEGVTTAASRIEG